LGAKKTKHLALNLHHKLRSICRNKNKDVQLL
jgi:hypothetical protein